MAEYHQAMALPEQAQHRPYAALLHRHDGDHRQPMNELPAAPPGEGQEPKDDRRLWVSNPTSPPAPGRTARATKRTSGLTE
jgi:hypothetical protein